jgi:ParB/RepB/Spo0J family partition protein
MSEQITFAQAKEEVGIDLRVVPIDALSANDYNPNEMEAELFESLVAAIKEEGMNQPILVRVDPADAARFLIIDGENRWQAAQVAGYTKVPVVVVEYGEGMSRVRTLSYNNIRGQNIPIKLARLLVDLHKEFSPAQIRAMTGIGEDDQISVLKLLEVPDFNPSDGIRISSQDVERPIAVNLLLMPDEHQAYTTAMKKAMKLAGDDVVALVGHEVLSYDQAMKGAMGIAGVKLRNVALALICHAFNSMADGAKEHLVKVAHGKIYDKLAADAQVNEGKKQATDKKVGGKIKIVKKGANGGGEAVAPAA